MYTNQPSLYVLHSLPSFPSSPSSWSALAVSSFLLIWNPRTIPSFSNHSYQLPIITNPIQYSYRHRHHCCFWRKHVWLLKSAKGGNMRFIFWCSIFFKMENLQISIWIQHHLTFCSLLWSFPGLNMYSSWNWTIFALCRSIHADYADPSSHHLHCRTLPFSSIDIKAGQCVAIFLQLSFSVQYDFSGCSDPQCMHNADLSSEETSAVQRLLCQMFHKLVSKLPQCHCIKF